MVENDPDFVNVRRFQYSLDKLKERYPEGAPDHVIAAALMITEDDVASIYEQVIVKLRELMKV